MKITFNDLLSDGSIKISFDGGYSFTDYNITDIHSNGGIVLDESQAFDKIMIKGPANLLKNLDIVSSVKIEGAESGGIPESEIQTIYYEIFYGGCGYGFRLCENDSIDKGLFESIEYNLESLYTKLEGNFISLYNLCTFDGHYNGFGENSMSDDWIYGKLEEHICPPTQHFIKLPFRLKRKY